ncbi:MAG: HYR domain-containing protein [Bacteroidetes bacterium]|nr:HYR domain-containing protein [Bacteroidota bacterium]
MKKLLFIFSLCFLTVGSLAAQCLNTSQFGSATINTAGAVVTVSTCSFDGEFSPISGAVSGQTLKFTHSTVGGVITIRSGSSNGPVVAFGASPLTFVNTFTGTLYAHWNSAGCGSASSCRVTTVQCASCTTPVPVDPCTAVTAINCGVNQTFTLDGAGLWSPGSCGFTTPGAERIYSFNVPSSGAYTLTVSGGTGGFVDYFYKSTAGGCSSTGWTCIDDISGSGTVTFTLAAGNYYLLADAEGTTSRTQTFNISCAPAFDPCANTAAVVCGGSQTTTLVGNGGGWSPGSCGFSTPGAEAVYTFTAPTTGVYTLNVSGGTGGYVDYFFKAAGAGCGATGWTCIDDISISGTVTFSLTAGNYFILLDGEGTTSRTQTWSIACPSPAPANDLCSGAISIACGSTVSGNTTNATADAAPSCNGFTVGTGGGLWYTFQGTGGFVTLSLCDPSTTYDSKLHVYEGSCTNPLCVTADDDACTSPGLASTATFCTTQGVTYYVLVNGFLSATGPFALSMSCAAPTVTINAVGPFCEGDAAVTLSADYAGGTFSGAGVSGNTFTPSAAGPGTHPITYTVCNVTATTTVVVTASPANDLVANAAPMACGTTVSGNTSCATSETLGVCGTTDGTGGGVWYVMPGNGNQITLTTCNAGTDFDTKLRVYTGSPASLTCLTGNDDIGGGCSTGPGSPSFKSSVTWCSTPGVDYYILVHGFSSAEGNFTLESSCSPVAPVIACSGNVTTNLDANCSLAIADYTGLTSASDDCGPVTVTQSPAAGTVLSGAGDNTITFTATDAGGNTATCSIILTLNDVTPPTAICQPFTAQLDANGSFTLSASDINNGSNDACGVASATIAPTSYSCANVGGPYVVVLTVTDVNGLVSTCTSDVTVQDNVAPVITCPANINVTAPLGQCNTTVTYEVTSTDACGSSVTSVIPASGSVFGLGTTTVNAVATDVNGNTSACSFTVSVAGDGIITLWGVPCDVRKRCDQIPNAPGIVACPSNGNGGSGSGSGSGSGHHGSGSGSGSHQCNYGNGGSGSGHGGSGSNGNYAGYNGYMTNPCGTGGSGSGSGSGSGHGGSGSGSNCNVYCVSHSCGVYATSLCGPCPTVTFNETIVPGTCANSYTIVRTWTATDTYGNSVSQSQNITVYDDVRPSINCPNNITVCVPNNGQGRTVNFNVTASDNCGAATVVSTPAAGSFFPVGTTWVTSTATDACGNTRSCTFRVKVERRNNCNSRLTGEPEAGDEKEILPALSISAFPNPTNGMVDVEISCNDCSADATYPMTVTDLYGKVVFKQDIVIADGQATTKLDLSNFASGMYMINVNNLTTRVVKE